MKARTMTLVLVLLLIAMPANKGAESQLARRAYLGLAVQTLTDEMRSSLHLAPEQGVLVSKVFPSSSASDAGIADRDIVLKLNDIPIGTPAQFVRLIKQCKVGEVLQIETLRGSARVVRSVPLKSFPLETSPDFEIIYGQVLVDGSRRRTIITRPKKSGKYPAVLFVGGIGCYSVDFPLDNTNPYKRLVYGITEDNFVTMRVEKSGVGDSEGSPCNEVDFDSEVRAYSQALNSLANCEFVDNKKIFVLGHSIGGIIAPILAAGFPLAGLIVADTVGISWFEYELENSRRQKQLAKIPPEEIDRQMRDKERCLHCLLVEKQTPEQLSKLDAHCSEYLNYPVCHRYIQQVSDLNLPQLWKKVDCPVLIIYGTCDYVTSSHEHEAIFEVMNSVHPGAATFTRIEGMDHSLRKSKSLQDSFETHADQTRQFESSIIPVICHWLRRITAV